MATLHLYDMFGNDRLRYRDTARQVVEKLSNEPTPITIDFAHIDFASLSFLSELIDRLDNRQVIFENRNNSVERLMTAIQTNRACDNH